MPFSSRLPSLRPNRLSQALQEMHTRGVAFLDLTDTNPTRVGLAYPSDLLQELASPSALAYDPEPRGLLRAREAVAADLARLGVQVDPDHLVLTASTSEAYGFLFKLLCDPGDDVLVPTPSYPLFEHLTALESVRAVPYALDASGGWSLDMTALEAAAGPRTRAVLIVSPNNPTGSMVRPSELTRLATFCASRGLAIVGDEVFADYRFPGTGATGAASVLAARDCLTFALGGLSKSIGLPQIKLAWMAIGGPASLVSEALARLDVITDAYLPVATPVQLALPSLLTRGAPVRAGIQARVEQNLAQLRTLCRELPACTLSEPAGGWSASLRVPATAAEEDLVVELLTRHAVRVMPGYFFDFPTEAWVVVSLLGRPEEFREGISRVACAISTGSG